MSWTLMLVSGISNFFWIILRFFRCLKTLDMLICGVLKNRLVRITKTKIEEQLRGRVISWRRGGGALKRNYGMTINL